MAQALTGRVTTHLATRTTSKDTATPQTCKAPTLKPVALGLRTAKRTETPPTSKVTLTEILGIRQYKRYQV